MDGGFGFGKMDGTYTEAIKLLLKIVLSIMVMIVLVLNLVSIYFLFLLSIYSSH